MLQALPAGPSPRACHSHAAAILGHHMYIHGGTSNYTHTFADLHALDLNTATWWCLTAAETPGNGQSIAAPACFSHTMTAAGDLLIVAGGCHTQGAGT